MESGGMGDGIWCGGGWGWDLVWWGMGMGSGEVGDSVVGIVETCWELAS